MSRAHCGLNEYGNSCVTVCVLMQLPSMKHGQDFVTDSSMIVSYLERKYPQQMALFTPEDPKLCAPHSPLRLPVLWELP